jgi:hypothetical protein
MGAFIHLSVDFGSDGSRDRISLDPPFSNEARDPLGIEFLL